MMKQWEARQIRVGFLWVLEFCVNVLPVFEWQAVGPIEATAVGLSVSMCVCVSDL